METEKVLYGLDLKAPTISSEKEMRGYIRKRAIELGFSHFMDFDWGGEVAVFTRVKFRRVFRIFSRMKILAISKRFVRKLFQIYKVWPGLGELLLETILWHEHQHLFQDPLTIKDPYEREVEANRLMLEKAGKPGLIAFLWYFWCFKEIPDKSSIINYLLRKRRWISQCEQEKLIKSLEEGFSQLIPSSSFPEIIEGVVWLDREYRLRSGQDG